MRLKYHGVYSSVSVPSLHVREVHRGESVPIWDHLVDRAEKLCTEQPDSFSLVDGEPEDVVATQPFGEVVDDDEAEDESDPDDDDGFEL